MKKTSAAPRRLHVPHASDVASHFSPKSVEQSGLGPAFFAVVIAIIALILLSIFGNNYLTGQYHRAGGDTVKLTDVTFAPFSQLSLNYTYGGTRYYGRFAGIRVFISSGPQSGLVFKDAGGRPFWDAYFVTRKIDATALPVGSAAYRYNGSWQALVPWREWYYDDYHRAYGFYPAGLTLYPSLYASSCVAYFCNYISPIYYFSPEHFPLNVSFSLGETYNVTLLYRQANGTSIYNYSNGLWQIFWNTSTRNAALQRVRYYSYPLDLNSVRVGYVAPSESSYRTPPAWPPGAVTIRYAYDARRR